jgi:hypothetical protein
MDPLKRTMPLLPPGLSSDGASGSATQCAEELPAQFVPQFPESALQDGKYASVEELAESAKLHPKVVRHGLRFAFLSPNIVESVLNGDRGLTLRNLRKVRALNWHAQQAELYEG